MTTACELTPLACPAAVDITPESSTDSLLVEVAGANDAATTATAMVAAVSSTTGEAATSVDRFPLSKDHPLTSAEAEIVQANLGLVRAAVYKFARGHYKRAGRRFQPGDLDDLASVAKFTLCKCVRYFDSSLGFEFSTYAMRAMIHDMAKSVITDGLIHVPRSFLDSAEDSPLREDAALAMKPAQSLGQQMYMGGARGGNDSRGGTTLADTLPDVSCPSPVDVADVSDCLGRIRAAVQRIRRALTQTTFAILELHVLRPELGNKEVAEYVGVSRERVRQVLDMAPRLIRAAMGMAMPADREEAERVRREERLRTFERQERLKQQRKTAERAKRKEKKGK